MILNHQIYQTVVLIPELANKIHNFNKLKFWVYKFRYVISVCLTPLESQGPI